MATPPPPGFPASSPSPTPSTPAARADAADDLVARLSRLDACAVSDALDKLDLPGCVTGLAPLSVARRIAGRVRTVKLVAAEQLVAADGPPRHLGTTAVMAARPGEVIVVEQRTGRDAGAWGGILSLGAKLRGVAGVIADGPVRDVDEARELDFPVYGRQPTARTARGRIAEAGTDVAVTIGDIAVAPGDYVIADGSAAVFVAAVEAERVIAVAEGIARREAAMAQALRTGADITQVMGADYENLLKGG
ncbi:MAG: RraA family protein [Burkholderiaceae bacterium]|nr:RraA family protein [Burkholderiaceae bacterium]